MSALWEELAPALAPACIAVAVGGAIGTIAFFAINGGGSPAITLIVSLFVMPLGWLLAAASAALLGMPAYMMMRSVGLRLHWWGGVLLGTIVAITPIGYLLIHNWFALQEHRANPAWDWNDTLKWGGPFALAGAMAGFTFWRVLPPGEAKA